MWSRFLGLALEVTGTAFDDFELVFTQWRMKASRLSVRGTPSTSREHVRAERLLQLGVLVQVVEHDLRNDALLELDYQTDALLVGLIAHIRDALDAFVVDELGDLLLQGALVDHVGNLGKDQAAAAGLGGLHMCLGTHGNGAAAGLVALLNAGAAHDDGTGGEVRTGHDLHELVDGGVGVVDQVAGGLDRLGEVMRSDGWWPCRRRCPACCWPESSGR